MSMTSNLHIDQSRVCCGECPFWAWGAQVDGCFCIAPDAPPGVAMDREAPAACPLRRAPVVVWLDASGIHSGSPR